jgi:LCP family protein required for cell wall assembly
MPPRLRTLLIWVLSAGFIVGGLATGVLAVVLWDVTLRAPDPVGEALLVNEDGSTIPSNDAALSALQEPGRVNVLILGIDRRPIETSEAPARTDTIMVASLDTVRKRASVLSIPRDLFVPIPLTADRTVLDRINAANVHGDVTGYPGGGTALVRATVELNFGVRIHHHVLLAFTAFERFIDAIGGIDLDLPEPLVDNSYPTADFRAVRVALPKGLQHLNGEKALWYARSRSQSSDFSRMQRQQQVLLAVKRRAGSLDLLPRAPALWAEFRDVVVTDLTFTDVLRLGAVAAQLPEGSVATRTLDEHLVSRGTLNRDPFLLIPNRRGIAQVVSELFEDPPAATDEAHPAALYPFMPEG